MLSFGALSGGQLSGVVAYVSAIDGNTLRQDNPIRLVFCFHLFSSLFWVRTETEFSSLPVFSFPMTLRIVEAKQSDGFGQ